MLNRLEKVVLLHRLLQASRQTISTAEILHRLECSESTFHRIRDFLKTNMGAPIVFDRKYKGYRYQRGEDQETLELPGLWFTHEELTALLCLDHAVESLHAGFLGRILHPLRARFEPLLKAQKTSMLIRTKHFIRTPP